MGWNDYISCPLFWMQDAQRRKVYLKGSLQTRKWTDQGGQERFTTEVIIDRFRGELTLLDSRPDGETGGKHGAAPERRQEAPAHGNTGPLDEIPF